MVNTSYREAAPSPRLSSVFPVVARAAEQVVNVEVDPVASFMYGGPGLSNLERLRLEAVLNQGPADP